MSSDLLQQAIIDAAALKEAAMKNAQNALIEKYSHEFNETVQKLLEQEIEPIASTDVATTTPVDPQTTTAADSSQNDSLSAEPSGDDSLAAQVDPMSGDNSLGLETGKDAFSSIPDTFSDASDDELININFDQIRTTLNEMLGISNEEHDHTGQAQGKDALSLGGDQSVVDSESTDPTIKVIIKGSKEQNEELVASDHQPASAGLEEEFELEEGELEESDNLAVREKAVGDQEVKLGQAKRDVAIAKAKNATGDSSTMTPKPTSMEEEIQLTEEELQELAEELRVDISVDNLSDGYMGSTVTQKREQRNLELAAARDSKAAEQREEELEKMKDLIQENENLKSLNEDLTETLTALKEQLENMNLVNAKLLYTNKALGNISLNERQKNQIVESISKADSVLAAKTIYEAIQNAVENTGKEKIAPQSLRETLNRAASPYAVKKSAANSINDLMAERMKALAGIKSNK